MIFVSERIQDIQGVLVSNELGKEKILSQFNAKLSLGVGKFVKGNF